jgi:hypothetical protein
MTSYQTSPVKVSGGPLALRCLTSISTCCSFRWTWQSAGRPTRQSARLAQQELRRLEQG